MEIEHYHLIPGDEVTGKPARGLRFLKLKTKLSLEEIKQKIDERIANDKKMLEQIRNENAIKAQPKGENHETSH